MYILYPLYPFCTQHVAIAPSWRFFLGRVIMPGHSPGHFARSFSTSFLSQCPQFRCQNMVNVIVGQIGACVILAHYKLEILL